MAANGSDNNMIRRIYTGDEIPVFLRQELLYGTERGAVILPDATLLTVARSINVIPALRFYAHPSIVELVCHESLLKIEELAFSECHHLRRVDMNRVEEVERWAFGVCTALENVECTALEKVGDYAFSGCTSLNGMNLPSARIVKLAAFTCCNELLNVTFGPLLESIESRTFESCYSLERITIPLKNGLFPHDDSFISCDNLRQVSLVEEEVLTATVAALFFEEWRQDMRVVIDSINLELSNAHAGYVEEDDENGTVVGEKTMVIRRWISSVLVTVIHYKEQHRRLLELVRPTLENVLPKTIVLKNVLPFLELPSHTFHGEEVEVIDDVKLKPCPKCDRIVMYCDDDCQERHHEIHEAICKKRAAELYYKERAAELHDELLFKQPESNEELLFKQPESNHLGDCLICFLPLPLDRESIVIHACCGNEICLGCSYANEKRVINERLKEHRCPFCRHLAKRKGEEAEKLLIERAELNDPIALQEVGVRNCQRGDFDKALRYFTKAATLGDANSMYNLSIMYRKGEGVEKDSDKERALLEKAAIAGHPSARHNLGCYEKRNGRIDRAVAHWIIAANLGDEDSIEALKNRYKEGDVSKDDFAAALRGYQTAVDAMKSPQRAVAEAYYNRKDKNNSKAAKM